MEIFRNCCGHLFRLALCLLLLNCIHAEDLRHGVAVSINGHAMASFESHTEEMFPLMSVVKFPLAIVVLHRVENGELELNMEYLLTGKELDPHTWSPMQKRHPHGGIFSLAELLRLCLCESDNNACNYLFELVGDPVSVQQFFTNRYGADFAFRVAYTEADMKEIAAKSVNQASPSAMRKTGCILHQRGGIRIFHRIIRKPHGTQHSRQSHQPRQKKRSILRPFRLRNMPVAPA